MNKPSRLKYIGAGILFFFIYGIALVPLLGYGEDWGLFGTMCNASDQLNGFFCAVIPAFIAGFAFFVSCILTYTVFASLNVKRAMPFLYFCALLHVLTNWLTVQDYFQLHGHSLTWQLWYVIVFDITAHIYALVAIKKHFIV